MQKTGENRGFGFFIWSCLCRIGMGMSDLQVKYMQAILPSKMMEEENVREIFQASD